MQKQLLLQNDILHLPRYDKKKNTVYLIIVMNASLVNVESLHWKKNKV